MSAPVLSGSFTQGAITSGTVLAVPKPSGVVDGDLLLAGVRAQASSASDITLPSGWARLGNMQITSDRQQGLYYKIVTNAATEPSSYNFTVGSGRAVGFMQVVKGVDLTDPFGNGSNAYGGTGTTLGRTAEAFTAQAAPYMVVGFWGEERLNGQSHVPNVTPSGFTVLANIQTGTGTASSRTTIWSAYYTVDDGGTLTVGAKTVEWATSISAPRGQMIALRGIVTPSPDPAIGLPVELHDGSAAAISVIYATERLVPEAIHQIRPGFVTVDDMVLVPGATWAHRGGSDAWPEMSEYAYDRCLFEGYAALEFSAQRTSDGVWFGLHNNALAETTENPALTAAINTMTWDQVNDYLNAHNSDGRPREFYRLEDFLDKYAPTKVVIVDPKNGISQNTEFLNIVEAHAPADHVVWKFAIGAAGAQTPSNAAAAARTRGFATWGYAYSADVSNGALAEHGPKAAWDFLGMSYNAIQTDWDYVLAFGKPVVAHIVPNQAGYDLAITRGADMVQTSGVPSVQAVS